MRRVRRTSEFLLVDLYSQREAVTRYVQGWRVGSILNWMRRHGTVEKASPLHDDGLYVFRSKWAGLKTSFYLTEKEGLVFMMLREADYSLRAS